MAKTAIGALCQEMRRRDAKQVGMRCAPYGGALCVVRAVRGGTLESEWIVGNDWRRRDSNPRPSHCERDALPTELRPLIIAIYPSLPGENVKEAGGSGRAATIPAPRVHNLES